MKEENKEENKSSRIESAWNYKVDLLDANNRQAISINLPLFAPDVLTLNGIEYVKQPDGNYRSKFG